MRTKVISRKEAINQGLKYYFTGKPCKNGHIAQRYCTKSVQCLDCRLEYNKKYRYSEGNIKYVSINGFRRTTARQLRTVSWSNYKIIKRFYKLRKSMIESSGIEHHIDHVYPLIGKTVSGLHVHENLRVIPKKDNLRKNSRIPTQKELREAEKQLKMILSKID